MTKRLTRGRKTPTALVTGAAGFIGCHLTERLVSTGGFEVRAVDDLSTGDWLRIDVPVERIEADLAELADAELSDLCDGADVVFHLAAEKHNAARERPERVIDVNVAATRRLFDAAGRVGVSKAVFTSSVYAYGSNGPEAMRETDLPAPTTTYGISKIAGELFLREVEKTRGLRWCAARVFFAYGPKQYAGTGYKSVIVANFERILRGEPPTIYGDGAQALDYIHVRDVVDALIKLAAPARHACLVNVCSGRAVTVSELTATMLDVAESRTKPIHCPPDWTAGSRRVGSTELVESIIDWRATTPLEDGLREVWQWLSLPSAQDSPLTNRPHTAAADD